MSTAGEAASLFGAPDTALDPFSTALGGDNPPDDGGGDKETANAVSDLFGSATDAFPVDGAGSSSITQQDAQQTWYDSAGQQTYNYDTATTNGYAPAYQPQSQTSYAPQNGTYSQYGQYEQYGQSPTYGQTASTYSQPVNSSAYQPSYAQQTSYASQSYAPYTQSTSSYTPASAAQNGAYSTSTYDPYKPAQTQSGYETTPNTVNTSAPVASAYDPYQPYNAAPAPAQTYSYGVDSHINPPVAVPPPPAPLTSAPPAPPPEVSVSNYRPKKLDAYDPPIPPPKARRVTVPPRQVFNTPPPVTPPPRTTLTPQSLVPPPKGPPRKTPDPHTIPPARRDSHTSTVHGSVHSPSGAGPYAPPLVNGSVHAAPYQPSYSPSPPLNYGAPTTTNGPYGGAPQNGSAYMQEGLPKVNDTYAPSTYSGLPQQPSAPYGSNPYEPAHAQHAGPASDIPSEQMHSPLSDPIPEVDENTPLAELYEPPDLSTAPSMVSSSPPTSSFDQDAGSVWPSETAQPPSVSSSPERTISPPRAATSATVQASAHAPASTYSPYAPPPKSNGSDRAKSPCASSIRSVQSVSKQSYDPPPRRGSSTISPTLSRPLSSQSRRSTLSNSYEPQTVADMKRTTSPTGSIRSVTAPKQSAYDPYAPVDKPAGPAGPSGVHGRTTSNGSTTSSVADPYAPTRHPVRTSSEHAYGSFALPAPTYAPSAPSTNAYAPSAAPAPTYDRTGAQVVTLAAPVHSTYAPSPSLLGTNDPLGRTSARVPVISFGFGGKLVTCFHGANMNTGFDVALSSRQSTDVKIYSLNKFIPESVLDTSATTYPGPLYSDPGSPTASIVRTGAQAQKAKKAKVVKYLEDRAEEMAAGLGYHRPGTVDRSRAEAKRILVLLLKAMVENDGRLSGSAQADSAVRAVLAPSEGATSVADTSAGSSGMIPATSTELLSTNYSLSSSIPNLQDQTISKTVVRSSQLDKIQELLVRGDRRAACHYAADEKLWSHALLIASSIDKETWKEVVTEWVRAELVTEAQGDPTNGREPLRVAYSLFGGNGAASIQELVHPKSLLQHGQGNLQAHPPPQSSLTPMTPNFAVPQPLNISQEVLASWSKTAAMILLNPMTSESSAALTALGDQLAAHQWTEAAHACYLLSPQTSPLGGLGSNPKLKLLGSSITSPIFYKDSDPIVFSEIAEFAMSLATPAKGQEPFIGFPHLQPYRLIRATTLAELGHVQLATRYCDAITNCINRGVPYLNITFVEQLKNLSDRLVAAPQLDKSGSWIPGKMAKPSLDSIGNWLEGRFTKFIAGENDSPRPEEAKSMMEQQQSAGGPFANYSSISSATTSAYPSPHQSVTDLTEMAPAAPPFRTGSALGNRPPSRSHVQINRASSAMDHVRPFQMQRGSSPIARVASANAATFADAASYGQGRTSYGNGYASAYGSDHLKPEGNSHGDVSGQHSKPPSSGSWGWGVSESDATTPTASTFINTDDQTTPDASTSGFVSLMDDPMLSMTPTATKQQGSPLPRSSQHDFDLDDDDLGLGNASSRKKAQNAENVDASQATPAKEEASTNSAELEKPELKQTASGGWLSRFWKRDTNSTPPAPVKANLGEESSFYYDKELKRWVNKTAGAEAPKPSPPPPPPRAQTASPGRQLGALQPPPSPLGPPPRPATTNPIDLSSEPPRRAPQRIRSNLVPDDASGPSAPPSPMPPSGTPPPGGRPRGGKRNVRSRYVDVFQQQEGGA